MRLRIFSALFSVVVVVLVALSSALSPNAERAKAAPKPLLNPPRSHRTRPDPPGTISGTQHPELIPDRNAYAILFTVLANRTAEEKNTTIRAYLTRFDPEISDADVDALVSAADEYRRRVGVLDGQVKTIKDKAWPAPPPAVMQHLQTLQRQKEAINDETTASLQSRVSPKTLNLIRSQVIPHIKSRTKITPDPQTPPGGVDWKPRQDAHRH